VNFADFSKVLITSGDLDPDYIFINNVCKKNGWDDERKAEWIALKSVIYNSIGELEFLLHEKSFANVDYGNERRKHKRNAELFWQTLYQTAASNKGFYQMFRKVHPNANIALKQLQKFQGIGPWAAWKILDLLNCCLGFQFDFSNVDFRLAYAYPIKGMLLVAGEDESKYKKVNDSLYKTSMSAVFSQLSEAGVNNEQAPPQYVRAINMQEIETCLCKYHSYFHGHYKAGEDIARLHARIQKSEYPNIKELQSCLPKHLT
tara:strand:- start:1234 stop:2013 length:780 start_codon:yes stop_codon:yes gene_type:complete